VTTPNEYLGSAHLIKQKDQIIEALRLELTEAHIRFVESENAEAGRIQELERTLLEARMSNAKLMEDNESYQILLRDKTLSGHFSGSVELFPGIKTALEREFPDCKASLADELETVFDKDEPEYARKLEAELSVLKEQNKALTLYINKIITRLLQSESFETLFENDQAVGGGSASVDKGIAQPTQSLLQRAGSVFGGRSRPKPQAHQSSQAGSGPVSPFNENVFPTIRNLDLEDNKNTRRPSMPLRRSDTPRSQTNNRLQSSELSASIVSNVYRGPPSGHSVLGGQISPGIHAPSRQSTYFAPTPPPISVEEAHESTEGGRVVSSDLVSDSGYSSKPTSEAPDQPSPPRSNTGSEGKPLSGTVLSATQGNKMRPLRLVQEKNEADEAALAEKKKANRASFMGWFGKPAAQ